MCLGKEREKGAKAPKGGPKGPLWGFRYGKPYPFVPILELMLALHFYFFVFVKFSLFFAICIFIAFLELLYNSKQLSFFSKSQRKKFQFLDSGPLGRLSTYNLNSPGHWPTACQIISNLPLTKETYHLPCRLGCLQSQTKSVGQTCLAQHTTPATKPMSLIGFYPIGIQSLIKKCPKNDFPDS